jgi:acetylglutamate synthase
MQLQVEYNYSPSQKQQCIICNRQYKSAEAKVIVCNNQGISSGEVCSECLAHGFNWISDRFEHLNSSRKKNAASRPQKTKVPIAV